MVCGWSGTFEQLTAYLAEIKIRHRTEKPHTTFPTRTHTIRLHRVFCTPPERVYRAFLEPGALVKWLPPHGFTGAVHSQDVRVRGAYRMSFTNLTTGHTHGWTGEYLELVPYERLRYTAKFDDPNLPGVMTTTVTLKKVLCGTELTVVQEGIPEMIPAGMCHLGWRETLELLTKLVEAEIPA
jgi:uncharacterized protein YndB with AHSA1/START domain